MSHLARIVLLTALRRADSACLHRLPTFRPEWSLLRQPLRDHPSIVGVVRTSWAGTTTTPGRTAHQHDIQGIGSEPRQRPSRCLQL